MLPDLFNFVLKSASGPVLEAAGLAVMFKYALQSLYKPSSF